VKFLVDNQLPPALARWLEAAGHDAVHVLDRDLALADDRELWLVAGKEERVVVSKDEDFFILATRPGETGRLLWIRLGNCRKNALISALEASWPSIEESFSGGQRIVEFRG
jgi:predicted nuclease of predicted toxin-antitoxin system